MPPLPPTPPPRRRKGIPSRAPQKTPGVTPSINVTLLLQVLLREGSQTSNLINSRYQAKEEPTHPRPRTPEKKRTRDFLPPVEKGYGRGKRSISVVSSGADEVEKVAPRERDVGRTASTSYRSGGLAVGEGGKRIRRAASTEPDRIHASRSASAASASSSASLVGRASPKGVHHRASSLGPSGLSNSSSYQDFVHSAAVAVSSPLARSDVVPTQPREERSLSVGAVTAVVGEGNRRGERESSRRLDAPHHLQDYEMAYTA